MPNLFLLVPAMLPDAPPTNATPVPDTPAPPYPATTTDTLQSYLQRNLLGPDAADFCDITLLSHDKVPIPAVRALLAVRSPYFRARLFATYDDRHHTHLPLDIASAPALRDLLTYIYIDTSPLITKLTTFLANHPSPKPPIRPSHAPPPDTDVATLVELIAAADYVAIPILAQRAADLLQRLLRSDPRLVCLVLEALRCFPSVELVAPGVSETLRDVMRMQPVQAFQIDDYRDEVRAVKRRKRINSRPEERVVERPEPVVLYASEQSMQAILQDEHLFTGEGYLFQVLYFWATHGGCLRLLKEAGKAGLPKDIDPVRWEQARRLVKCLDLTRMHPSFVQDCVEPTGLVDADDIYNTYRQLAIQAERNDLLYNTVRARSVWADGTPTLAEMTEGRYCTHMLKTPWVFTGVHEWTFLLERESDCSFLGMSSVEPGKGFFGNEDTGWAFGMQGVCTHHSRIEGKVGPTVAEGMTVKLVLNLLKSGTMTVVVQGALQSFVAFRHMKHKAKQFVPVAYVKYPSRITLLDERHSIDQR